MAVDSTIVEIDPALIDSSFVLDRMPGPGADHDDLIKSIKEHGQQVPVLLRPHPTDKGRFQVAYGHRRVRALATLNIPVKALVRELTDAELVVAQGQENNARKDLSFIERACFAATLEDRQFSRAVIMAALNVDKSELSRLISVRRSIHETIIAAIGAAPRTGRRRWVELADRLAGVQDAATKVASVLASADFGTAPSDRRFQLLYDALAPAAAAPRDEIIENISDDDGRTIARVERGPSRVMICIDEKVAVNFGKYLMDRIPDLFRSFHEGTSLSQP